MSAQGSGSARATAEAQAHAEAAARDDASVTSVTSVSGPRSCGACKKQNHAGVSACVFCGHALGASDSEESAMSSGPTSPSIEPEDEDVPQSRRAQRTSLDEILPAQIADPLIGVVVAERYRILDAIGRGGMGIVYKVEHTRIGKLLAMKLLTGELSRNPAVVRRFKQEALTASKLSSPNTVQVFDFGASEGLTYLVMELVAGEDLGRVLRASGPMPFARLGKIIVQVASSLAEAHQKGIVHRDVKPENIMLLRAARDGVDVAKVLDFGLAKLREGSELNDVTSQGAIVGTPYFMSPEQVRGEMVDARTDIYALGALMYRALTGFYPFSGPTPMAVFTKHLTELPIPPHERAPEQMIPIGVSDIVLKALEKNPADRYARVEDLQLALLEELKAVSASSVDTLLDSVHVRKLAKVAAEVEMKSMLGQTALALELATRDELVAYERKLRRLKYTAACSALFLVAAAGVAGTKFVIWQSSRFGGEEVEPNDVAAEAQSVPFGEKVMGRVGRRIDPRHADRDFYAIDVPRADAPASAASYAPAAAGRTLVALEVTALPNFATCTFVYKAGFADALGQYCVGIAGRDLVVPTLALDPGKYLIAVTQDTDGYGGETPPVFENVSDTYSLRVSASADEPDVEIEPNDQLAAHNVIAKGKRLRATIAWAHDEDVFCMPEGEASALRWKITDAPTREANAVLEVTLLRGADELERVRVHANGTGKPTSTDVSNGWISGALPNHAEPRCLRVRLAPNPWSGERTIPRGSREPYAIEVLGP